MIKQIGERISSKQHNNYATIVISTKVERWQESILLLWIIAWTFCGIAFIYYLLSGALQSQNEKLVLFIITVFWAYFQYRIVKTYLWRKFGLELIKIDKDLFTIKKSILSYGKAVEYKTKTLDFKKVESFKQNPKSFSKVMNDSFWLIGQGVVRFSHGDKFVYFGNQLEADDSEKLAIEVRRLIKKYGK